MRLIDADALKEVLIKEKGFYPAMVASAIDNSPTIQMTSVETKTGEKEERGLQDNVGKGGDEYHGDVGVEPAEGAEPE